MDIDIRKAVIANCAGNSPEQIEATIVDAIQGGEEKTLPGLGVFFELCWNAADENERQAILSNIEKELPEQATKPF
ncbi:MAG TPA: small acid-soluble spore protein SspI [Bacillales bacterium]|nr:small acid-soluble spore protein SspI [Bacillales bacterium]